MNGSAAMTLAIRQRRAGEGHIDLNVVRDRRLAREQGIAHLDLAASLNAQAFYRALGYLVRERSDVRPRNGHRLPCVWMRKRLRTDEE